MYALKNFKLPEDFRGKPSWYVQLWWLVQATLFRMSPQFMYGWRNVILRFFGAKIGKGVIIRPTARITYPWKLSIGDYSWIGDYVDLYTLGEIKIGSNSIISQRSYICTGSHDYTKSDFRIYQKPITIGDSVWLATDVFVAPGVEICNKVVVGSRSSVYQKIENSGVYKGNPVKWMKDYTIEE